MNKVVYSLIISVAVGLTITFSFYLFNESMQYILLSLISLVFYTVAISLTSLSYLFLKLKIRNVVIIGFINVLLVCLFFRDIHFELLYFLILVLIKAISLSLMLKQAYKSNE